MAPLPLLTYLRKTALLQTVHVNLLHQLAVLDYTGL